jgi:hypothetical protein
LIVPITKRLKLRYDNLLSSFAFKFNLRRYTAAAAGAAAASLHQMVALVGLCRLTLSNPC